MENTKNDRNLQKDIIKYLLEFENSSVPEISSKFQTDSKFRFRGKETIRECVKRIEKDNLIEVSSKISPKQGGKKEKKYSLTHFGFNWYCKTFQIGSKEFWSKLFGGANITSDFYYETKKGRGKIIIENQALVKSIEKRKIGFDASNSILFYEKYFLKASHFSLYPQNIQESLESYEDLREVHKDIVQDLKNIPEEFEKDPKLDIKKAKKIIRENLKKFPKIRKTYEKYKFEINQDVNNISNEKLSEVYIFLKPSLQGHSDFYGNTLTNEELEDIQKLFGLKPKRKWDEDVIIETIYQTITLLGINGKIKKKKLFKLLRKNLDEWQIKHILLEMVRKNFISFTIYPSSGYRLTQIGLILLFHHFILMIYHNTNDDRQEEDKIASDLNKIIRSTSEKFKVSGTDLTKKVLQLKKGREFSSHLIKTMEKHEQNRIEEFSAIRKVIKTNENLFPKIFSCWDIMVKFSNDKKLLDVFEEYYFTKEKFLLLTERRELEIDLLNSQKAIESSYRFELEKFFQDGIKCLNQWEKNNNSIIKILDTKFSPDPSISLKARRIINTIDYAKLLKLNPFEIKGNEPKSVQNFKSFINTIIEENYFPHPLAKQILSKLISNFISDLYYLDLKEIFVKIDNEFSKQNIEKLLVNIANYTKSIRKIILLDKPLRQLILLDKILHSDVNQFGGFISFQSIEDEIQKQSNNAFNDFVSFQFFTSLYLRGPNIWKEVMRDKSLSKWYSDKLEEIIRIDNLRFERTKNHRNEILQLLSS